MKRARSLFTMVLAMAFIATVLVPSTSEAAYKKRVLPSACDGATVDHFWADKVYKFIASSEGQDLFTTAMAALDPNTGGEFVVAQAKWDSLCDPQRKAYLVWMESVVRVGLYLNYDYVDGYDGPSIFGGKSYPDSDGDTETLTAMDIEEIGELFQKEPRIFDIIAVGRPGTPHSGSTLSGFTSAVCSMTGKGCPAKKAPAKAAAPKAKATSGSSTSTGSSGSASSQLAPAPATPTCKDGKGVPVACPPPANDPPAP